MNAKQMKPGMIIEFRGNLCRVLEVTHFTPGNLRAFVQAKIRNVETGIQIEHKFISTESVERAILDTREVEYLYQDGDFYNFMDIENYEQFHLSAEDMGDAVKYLQPNMKLRVGKHEGRFVNLELPKTVKLKVTDTEPYIKTATATNMYKRATVETGAVIQVPGFINEGELIEIDTETGDYLGRAK